MSGNNNQNIAQKWVEAAEARDAAAVAALLADDVLVMPPFLEEPVVGTKDTLKVFGAFVTVTEGFEYGRVWAQGDSAVLEFRATIDGKPLMGLDVIETDENGQITKFEICARPLSSIQALGEAARARL